MWFLSDKEVSQSLGIMIDSSVWNYRQIFCLPIWICGNKRNFIFCLNTIEIVQEYMYIPLIVFAETCKE